MAQGARHQAGRRCERRGSQLRDMGALGGGDPVSFRGEPAGAIPVHEDSDSVFLPFGCGAVSAELEQKLG